MYQSGLLVANQKPTVGCLSREGIFLQKLANVTCHLFLYGLQAKHNFHIFKIVGQKDFQKNDIHDL